MADELEYVCEKCVHYEVCDRSSRMIWARLSKEKVCTDFMEVTRCKDCDNTCQGNHGLVCTIWGAGTDPDGWCYKGERREENATG